MDITYKDFVYCIERSKIKLECDCSDCGFMYRVDLNKLWNCLVKEVHKRRSIKRGLPTEGVLTLESFVSYVFFYILF